MSVAETLDLEVAPRVNWYEISRNKPFLDELHDVVASNDFVWAMRRSAQLAECASRSPDPAALLTDLKSFADEGAFPSLLAIESVAVVQHEGADDLLIDLLSHPAQLVRRHASWRLGCRLPTPAAFTPLLEQLVRGGVDTMHAHRTLRRWAAIDSHAIFALVAGALATEDGSSGRARLVDLLGVVEDSGSSELLLRLAADRNEATSARIAAIGALGGRTGDNLDVALRRLARLDDEVGAHASLALNDLATAAVASLPRRDGGLRIAQLVLAGCLDGQLSLGGRGETGGVASLLVSLGEALARRADVDHVLTIGRGTVADALAGPMPSSHTALTYGTIAVGDDARPAETANDAWEHLPAIERGIRRVLRLARPIDLLHLRMADVGTLAGARVASEMGVPICFSLAPDPHNVVQSLQSRGELDQGSFVRLATETDVWFRARLVERLAREADRLALFPRSRPTGLFDDLGLESGREAQRTAVVAEGIDVGLIRRAEANYAGLQRTSGNQRDVLDDLGGQIPEDRRGLPLLLSIGRLHPIKGAERVVAAWASDPLLHETCNLVIVGGDLAQPSMTERTVLEAIDQALPADDSRRAGLVLLGGRPRADVARLLAATAQGRSDYWSSNGVYVDGALKEEFGLALIEALAAGLVVTAPSIGGPPTYVDHGDTGILVDPDADLARAIRDAFGLVNRPGRARRAREMVEARYSIETMAAQLIDLYRPEPAML